MVGDALSVYVEFSSRASVIAILSSACVVRRTTSRQGHLIRRQLAAALYGAESLTEHRLNLHDLAGALFAI